MPWRSSRCTRPVRFSPAHGMPLISRRPPAARRLTAASFSKPSSARNSAFWSSRAPGSRNRVTQRANRAASVSCVDIGSVNLGGTPTPGNAAGFREHRATDRYTRMPATGPIVRALRAAHLHDAPRADLIRRGRTILGQLDVDSDVPAGFTPEHHEAVRAVADALAVLL